MSSASDSRKYPSKRMNGLALMPTVSTQLVVARKKSALRSAPSSHRLQASVANPASANSVAIPAAAMRNRSRRSASFQDSDVSV